MDTGARFDWTEEVYDYRRRGTYIISVSDGERSHMHGGCWVSPVSHRPPRMGVAMPKEMEGARIALRGRRFGLSLIAEDQRALMTRFFQGAQTPADLGEDEIIYGVQTGVPLWTHAVTQFECWLEQSVDLGDFLWLIGRTVTATLSRPALDMLANDISPIPKARLPFRGYDDVRLLPSPIVAVEPTQ